MRRSTRALVGVFAAAFLIGCGGGDKKASIPKNLNQPLPEGVGSGGGGPAKAKTPAPNKSAD